MAADSDFSTRSICFDWFRFIVQPCQACCRSINGILWRESLKAEAPCREGWRSLLDNLRHKFPSLKHVAMHVQTSPACECQRRSEEETQIRKTQGEQCKYSSVVCQSLFVLCQVTVAVHNSETSRRANLLISAPVREKRGLPAHCIQRLPMWLPPCHVT